MLPYRNTALKSLEFYTFNCFQQMTTCSQYIAQSVEIYIYNSDIIKSIWFTKMAYQNNDLMNEKQIHPFPLIDSIDF